MSSKKNNLVASYSADALLQQPEFLSRYGISSSDFRKSKLKWQTLEQIYNDYVPLRAKLEHTAKAIVDILLSNKARDLGVHSVRYRVKDAHGLIEKIIRKKIEDPERQITLETYRNEITDLIGIRALHVFKTDIVEIHRFITDTFKLKKSEKPIHYHREGDDAEYLSECKKLNCMQKKHPKGYRSFHYIVSTQLTSELTFAEIQVRTVFEEGWSEIDHRIRYIYKGKETEFDDNLGVLNRMAGNADDVGMNIKKQEQLNSEKMYKDYQSNAGKYKSRKGRKN